MQKAINRLHRQLLADAKQGNGTSAHLSSLALRPLPTTVVLHHSPAATRSPSQWGLSRRCAETRAFSPPSVWLSP